MKIYLVTASDYDYSLIDSAWATREEAEARITYAQSLREFSSHADFVHYSYNFTVKEVTLGEVQGETERYNL